MKTYLALLRGINVGGNNKVPMSKLKEIFESLGHQKIITYINSGNVIFETQLKDPQLVVVEIQEALKKAFGFEIKVLLRSSKNILALTKKLPSEWNNDAEQKTDVLFLWDEYDNKNSINLIKTNPEVDNLKYFPGAIIWNVSRKKYNKSGMAKFVGTKIYQNMTARNINTVRKLAELMK